MKIESLSLSELRKVFAMTPTAKKLIEDHERVVVAKRRELQELLAAGDREFLAESVKLAKAAAQAKVKAEELLAKLGAAEGECHAKRQAIASATHVHERRTAELRRQLDELSPPIIADFLAEMGRELAEPIDLVVATEVNAFGQDSPGTLRTNKPSIVARHKAIREATVAAERLRYVHCDDVPAMLDSLRARIPAVAVVSVPDNYFQA